MVPPRAKFSATDSVVVHEETPHQTTVPPCGYCLQMSLFTPRHSTRLFCSDDAAEEDDDEAAEAAAASCSFAMAARNNRRYG